MSLEVMIVLALLLLWMFLCAWCGYKAQFKRYLMVLAVGLALDMFWMIYGLKAVPFSHEMLLALAAGVFWTLSSFGAGWIVGRFTRSWRESRVNAP